MTEADSPFGRQPRPVKLQFSGEQIDIETYMRKLMRLVEGGSLDSCIRHGNQLTIYPRAVND